MPSTLQLLNQFIIWGGNQFEAQERFLHLWSAYDERRLLICSGLLSVIVSWKCETFLFNNKNPLKRKEI